MGRRIDAATVRGDRLQEELTEEKVAHALTDERLQQNPKGPDDEQSSTRAHLMRTPEAWRSTALQIFTLDNAHTLFDKSQSPSLQPAGSPRRDDEVRSLIREVARRDARGFVARPREVMAGSQGCAISDRS